MGQRLVILVRRNDVNVATVYYHWSAYSNPAIACLSDMHNDVLSKADTMSDRELQLALIRHVEKISFFGFFPNDTVKKQFLIGLLPILHKAPPFIVGQWNDRGGLDESEFEHGLQTFPGETFILEGLNRNYGLVNITEQGIKTSLNYAEGLIVVDLTSKNVQYDVVFKSRVEDYDGEEYEFDEDMNTVDDIPSIPIDITSFNMSNIDLVRDILLSRESGVLRYEDTIFTFID
jgi:hypothetical protein